MSHRQKPIRPSTSLHRIPQYVEVPPNIEANQIVSYFSAILVYQSNPLLLKDDSKLLFFFRLLATHLQLPEFMILIVIRMKVLSQKRMELSQTIASLIGSIRAEKGCKRCDFYQSIEDENELCLIEEWDTQKNLKIYLKSGRFRVLRGAMNLLEEPYEMMFHTVFHPTGMAGI